MKSNLIYAIHQEKIWLVLAIALFAGLFWTGYHHVIRVNQPESLPPTNPTPLTIPREYNPGDSLLDLKINRDRERSRSVERVQELLDKIGLSDQVRQEAEQELWRLTQISTKEQELENLLGAKGFKESLVTISHNFITIVVKGKLQAEQVKSIGQLATELTDFNLDQIQIVER